MYILSHIHTDRRTHTNTHTQTLMALLSKPSQHLLVLPLIKKILCVSLSLICIVIARILSSYFRGWAV